MIGGASLRLPGIAAAGVRARALEPGGAARRLHRPPLLFCSLAFIAGAALAVWGAGPAAVHAGLAATAAACLVAAWQTPSRKRRNRLNFALLLLAPVAFYAGYWHADRSGGASAELAIPTEQEVSISGVVVRDPVARFGGTDLRVRVDRVMLGNESAAADAVVQLRVPPGGGVELGDRVAARTVLEPIAGVDGDYLAYLEREGVAATARAGAVERDAAAGDGGGQGAFLDARRAVSDALARALPPPLDGVAQAMVTGRRSSIDPHRREQLADTGLVHLVVVSGSNITIIAAFFIAASSWLIGRRAASVLALAAVAFYALFSSAGLVDAPIFRASVMAAVLVTAGAIGRGTSVSVALSLAAALIVAADPTALASASFQLSFAGMMAIALVAPGVINRVMAGGDGIAGTLRDLLILHVLATIATLPVIAIHMGEIPLVSVPANLLVAPFFAWMFIGSGIVALAGLASGGLAQFFAWPLGGAPLSWLLLVAEQGAAPPFSTAPVPRFGLAHLLVVYAGLAVAAIRLRSWREPRTERPSWLRSPAAPAFAAVALAGAAAAIGFAQAAPDERAAVHFLDVGQGDASLISTAAGRTVLIDGGPDGAALFAALDDVLPANSGKIDAVVLTHPQMDHAGGLFSVIERHEVGQLIVSPANARWPLGRRLERAARERGVPVREVAHGDLISFDDDSTIDVLWPMRDRPVGNDPNAASLVLRAALGNAVFLFTGDVRAKEELALAFAPCSGGLPCDLRADVLKVAHQGSRSSSTNLFLRRADPEIAVISAGERNPHGHPHPEAVARLERAGARIFTTARHGTISVFPDGSVRVHGDAHGGLP